MHYRVWLPVVALGVFVISRIAGARCGNAGSYSQASDRSARFDIQRVDGASRVGAWTCARQV